MPWAKYTHTAGLLKNTTFRYVFSVLSILLMMFCICGSTYAANITTQSSIELFSSAETKMLSKNRGLISGKGVVRLYSPFFVGTDGVMVVFASANYTEDGKSNIDIVARYIGTEGDDWVEKAFDNNGNNWETRLVMQSEERIGYVFELRKSMAVAKDNKIYLLAVNYEKLRVKFDYWGELNWNFELAVGEIKPTSGKEGSKVIGWKTFALQSSILTQQFKIRSLEVVPHAGSAFLTYDGKIVFVVRAKRGDKDVSAIIHLKDTGNDPQLEMSYVETTGSCYSPFVFGWNKKIIMVTRCQDGSCKMKESADMGRTWANVVGSIARVWDNFQDKRDFTTVTTESKTVLLFTQRVDKITAAEVKYEIHLWFADTSRVQDLGPIVVDNNYVVSGGLLYTNGELFFLHQKWDSGPANVILTRLKGKLERIKSVLNIWAETDEYLSKPCEETVPLDAPSGTFCITPMPTDGLVGFLSNTTTGDIWQDEYFFVNATVKGGIKVDNGFTFRQAGSGARWSVSQPYPNRKYNFARYGLTVVATVTIHEVPEVDTPLLTFGRVIDKERLGLWYDKNKKWKITLRNVGSLSRGWQTNKTYLIVVMLQNSSLFAYVNGECVGVLFNVAARVKEPHEMEHIFIGGFDEGSGINTTFSHVTVTNVFLYNLLFPDADLQVLGKRKPIVFGLVLKETVQLFLRKKIRVHKTFGGLSMWNYVKCFLLPSLVGTDGIMVAFASADYTEDGKSNIDIVARYIGTEGDDWVEKAFDNNGNNWETRLVMQSEERIGYVFELRKSMAVAKDNKIYLLAVNYEKLRVKFDYWGELNWNFELAVGEIKPTSGKEGSKVIGWKTFALQSSILTQQFKIRSLEVVPHAGSAFLTYDGKIVFVVRAKRGDKDVSAIIHLKDTGNDPQLEMSYVETTGSCYSPFVFGWNKKIIMVTRCQDGSCKMKESADMGRTWANVVGSIARVWDNFQDKRDFTTVTTESKTVLLFTQRVDKITAAEVKYEIHLWFADTSRVQDLGPIVVDNNYVVSGGLLYTNGELFFLHQKWDSGPANVILTRLKGKLERIKSVLNIWAETDEYLSKPCEETVPLDAPSGTFCITPMPTDGLVGFLSNTTTGDIWQDEYFFVNATVKGGIKVDNGFTFRQAGSGARWSVSQPYPNRKYNFARYGLTVVATVTIHEVPEVDTPLLTFGRVIDKERLGLWYDKNKKWKITLRNVGTFAGGWQTNKTYLIVVMLQNSSLFAYVNGECVGVLFNVAARVKEPHEMEHIFIGGFDEGSGINTTFSHVTVTNVLLYNRPFDVTQLEALGKRTVESLKPRLTENERTEG